ncbi:hypothetical protein [Niastella sp. OAS944]|uniref:hypothetical protein n=1 Tax=Niastella sp. OAS944 TaxID=2664089 RepID=UPI003492CC27|nr:hypothetical protein [Chitinophagaceae bacterium OAS944]
MNKIISLIYAAGGDVNGILDYLNSLNITFNERDSSYTGGYHKAAFENGTIRVYSNYQQEEKEWRYESFKQYPYVIGVRIDKGKKLERENKGMFFEDAFSQKGFMLISKEESPTDI